MKRPFSVVHFSSETITGSAENPWVETEKAKAAGSVLKENCCASSSLATASVKGVFWMSAVRRTITYDPLVRVASAVSGMTTDMEQAMMGVLVLSLEYTTKSPSKPDVLVNCTVWESPGLGVI